MKVKSLLVAFLLLSLGTIAPAAFANEHVQSKTDPAHEHKSHKKSAHKSHHDHEKKHHDKQSHSHAVAKKNLPVLELTELQPHEDKHKDKHKAKHGHKHKSKHAAKQDCVNCSSKKHHDNQELVSKHHPHQTIASKHSDHHQEVTKKTPAVPVSELKPKVGFPEAASSQTTPPAATLQTPVKGLTDKTIDTVK